eukprot:COSAG04_NODE_21296_length_376_cov_0.898917_1_plen_26_part_10
MGLLPAGGFLALGSGLGLVKERGKTG